VGRVREQRHTVTGPKNFERIAAAYVFKYSELFQKGESILMSNSIAPSRSQAVLL
jgi:hypothetical protein